MSEISLILKYFPDISDQQKASFAKLENLYQSWNEKINVISRQDIRHLYLHHVLHSLAIARFIAFPSGSKVLDAGTGGGFPGIPLSIIYPDVKFTLADSIGKKIKVVKGISGEIDSRNIRAVHTRVELIHDKFDYIVSRAVTNMPRFLEWTRHLIRINNKLPIKPGIISLKGGDLKEELGELYREAEIISLTQYFDEDFFASKKIVYLPVK